jgi:geranylgeranyl reductase family protein
MSTNGVGNKHNSVVVIGAGPGGAATAVRLAQRGVKNVVLLDRDEFPRDKTCGSCLSPMALKTLDELGMLPAVKEKGYLIRTLVVKTPGNREMRLTTDAAAIILLRKYFDNMLVEKAKELGVDFRPNFKATELVRDGSGRAVGVRSRDQEVRADYVIAADGAHSIFSWDPRPKRTISTLVGWWEGFPIEPHTIEMVFDKNIAPLYGWMFPEGENRINIGICMEGEEKGPDGKWVKTTRNVREVFNQFIADHYADRLRNAKQIGKFKGHPISYTTWVRDCTAPGMLYIGEGARMTHNATGEGIYQAMQSGVFAADAVADVLSGVTTEAKAWNRYLWQLRKRFTLAFALGWVVRGIVDSPILDLVAQGYNSPTVRGAATWALGSILTGSHVGTGSNAEPVSSPSASVAA